MDESASIDGNPRTLDERVDEEKIRLFAAQAGRVVLSLLPLDGFLVWLIAQAGLLLPAFIWAGTGAVLQVIRWHVAQGPAATPKVVQIKLKWLNGLSGLLGVVRASIVPLLFSVPVSTIHFVYTMVLVGQLSGAVGSLGTMHRAYLYWATPLVASIALAWWVQGTFEERGVATLVVLLFAILTGYARNGEKTLRQLIEFAFQREALAASLRTERDRAEEIGRANETLAESLRIERDRAQAASVSKTRFFAAASHDLRQPLHALLINATTLELVVHEHHNPLLRELSQGINRSLQQSNLLLQGLLDISKLDAGAVKACTETIDVDVLLRGVVEEFRPLAEQRGLSMAYVPLDPPSQFVDTDRELMLRILNNLVSNALKFTRVGTVTVYARLAVAETDFLGRVVVLGVADTGQGIPADEREKVFDEFYQIGNASRDRGEGLGLGLSIVRRTAELLHCPLTLHSDVDVGTRIEIALIASEGRAMPELAPKVGGGWPLLAGVRVLAIDDESEILFSINNLLVHLGCKPRCVADLAAAHRHLDEGFEPQILIVDYRLRAGNGLDAIEQLQDRLGGVPAILVTGDTLPGILQQAQLRGIPVIHKPVDGKGLAEKLDDLVRSRRAPAKEQSHES